MKAAAKKPVKKAGRMRPLFVIVPKTQMRAKTPTMLADPKKVVVVQLTDDLANAAKFTGRSGAFRRIARHKELAKKFWYRRVYA
jgi:hypothetical protein